MLAGWPCLGHLLSRWLLDPPDLDPPFRSASMFRSAPTTDTTERPPTPTPPTGARLCCRSAHLPTSPERSRSRNLSLKMRNCRSWIAQPRSRCCAVSAVLQHTLGNEGRGGQAWASFFLLFGFISDWWRKCAACLLVSAVLYYARGGIMWPGSYVGKHFLYFQNSQSSKMIGQAHHPFFWLEYYVVSSRQQNSFTRKGFLK